jgi:hypothetical protein
MPNPLGADVRPTRLLASLASAAIVITGCGAATDPPQVTATTSRALAPNGVEKLSAAGIVAKARKATVQASAVRIKGDVTDSGQHIRFDMRLLADRGGTGTLTVRGGSVRITRIGRRVYMKGSATFWTATAGSAAAKLFADKWLKGSASEPGMASLIRFTDLDALMTDLFKDVPDRVLRRGRERQIGGRRAITVTMTGPDGGLLYVALDGKPYPLRIQSLPGAREPGRVEFLDYDERFVLSTPPASQTIDMSEFNSG